LRGWAEILRTLSGELRASSLPGPLAPLAAGELRAVAVFVERGSDLARMAGRIETLALLAEPYVAPSVARELARAASAVNFEAWGTV
jgi:hypothetical protein